ncbi:MAG: hypothetical protein KAU48_08215 [Candidatus Thorarchaeota archaeon]|nr:hypothetical protein [Candidatus Thorarchaeota archaeon]
MKLHDTPELKWMTLTVFLSVLLFKFYFAPTDLLGLAISGAAVGVFVVVLSKLLTNIPKPDVFWDKERGIASILRFWTVEVSSARLLSSVPIGIDLSHSGNKVFQSMYTRFSNETGGNLVFFITRPMGNQSTKVGFLVRRQGLRLWNGWNRIDSLAKKLVIDVLILESSMRAAYPHLPVEAASFEDILTTTTGGLETHAIA